MFQVFRYPSGVCEIRVDFQERQIEEIPHLERRAFMRLSYDLLVANAWLAALGANTRYAIGTIHEYAKVLLYALEWLALEPVNVSTQEPVGHSLFSLSRGDLRSLFAWLDIPAHRQAEREYLAKTGTLPPGFRKNALAPATHNLRATALTVFYDWVIAEYISREGTTVGLVENPLKDIKRPISHFQQMQRPDGFLPRSSYHEPEPSRLFRQRQHETGPVALTSRELQRVLNAIPLVSHGRNAANRNGALIRLLLWGMLRQEELINARWEAVDENILWVIGKGSKRRMVPIVDPSTWSYLRAYTSELRVPSEQRFHGPLLRQLDHENRPITRHTIEHLIKALQEHFLAEAAVATRSRDYGEAQSLKILSSKLHSHVFRATGATYMAKAGMNLVMLSLLLGHSSPRTTMHYYIDAQQLDLFKEVQRIFEEISAAMASTSPSHLPHSPADTLNWYQRRGLTPS